MTDTAEDWARWEREYVAFTVGRWRAWLRARHRTLTADEREAVECYIDTAERMNTSGAATSIRKYVVTALRFRRPDFGRTPAHTDSPDGHPDADQDHPAPDAG